MSETADDPRCPECGGPVGQTATYCMHCSADLTDDSGVVDAGEEETLDQTVTTPADSQDASEDDGSGQLLDPDGVVDNTLTVVVGIGGGIIVGVVGTFVLLLVTGSAWAFLFGLVVWLGSTAHLVRRRTVQGAVSRSGYAVALVLLLVPVIAFSPVASVSGGFGERGGLFLGLLVFVAVPAGIAAVVGWVASKFVPDDV